jgi:hypothetical protein
MVDDRLYIMVCSCGARWDQRNTPDCPRCSTKGVCGYCTCSCGYTWDKAGTNRCPRCGREDAPGVLRQVRAELEAAKELNLALQARILEIEARGVGLVRACFEVAAMDDATRIAERPENLEHVLGVMYEKAAQDGSPRYAEAVTLAEKLKARLAGS